jgi:hypothetical protein
MKAWIELEGEINNLLICAKVSNETDKSITIDYVLDTKKNGRLGKSLTSQKGKCIVQANKVLSLSEARLNLSKKDELYINLSVYHNKKLVAQDSVVLHGYNQ